MDQNIVHQFKVTNLKGKDEFEVYKNYVAELSQGWLAALFESVYKGNEKVKNDQLSLHWRKLGNELFCKNDPTGAINLYVKSLRYSTYNSQSYAVTLANRSAVFFSMENYQNCLKDIDLCLRAKYPDCLKPKVYIRKAECYQKLGEPVLMRKALKKLTNFLNETSVVPDSVKEKYAKEIKDMMLAPVNAKSKPEKHFDEVPVLEPNPSFHNASFSIVLKHNKNTGLHVYAQKDISVGEVVLIDKAYAFTPCFTNGKMHTKANCQHCAKKMVHSVPCKSCIKHIYCSEGCRDIAWKQFHQWECKGIQAGFLQRMWVGYLALRIVLKAAAKGLAAVPTQYNEGVIDYIKTEDAYPNVFNLSSPFKAMTKVKVLHYVTTAVMLVHYLNVETNFFPYLKKYPMYADKSPKELMNHVGGLIVRHLAQFNVHGVIIKDFDMEEPKKADVGLSVCPAVALMNHSCDPNTSHYFVGDTVVVKAMRDIKAGEELFYPYMNTTYRALGTQERREIMQDLCNKICNCSACSNPKMDLDKYNAYICIKCRGAAYSEIKVPIPWKQCFCLDCNEFYALPSEVFNKEKLAVKYLAKFTARHDLVDAHATLKISKTVFRPTHGIYKIMYEELMQYYELRDDVVNFIATAKQMNCYLESIHSKYAMENGFTCHRECVTIIELLNKLAFNMNVEQLKESLQGLSSLIAKAKFIFSIHYPAYNARFRKMETNLFQFRVLHVMRIANNVQFV